MATDFELQVLQELGDIKRSGAATEAGLIALNERLFQNPTGILPVMHEDIRTLKEADLSTRIRAMEDDLRDHKKWQNIKLIVSAVLQTVGSLVGIHYKGGHA